MADDTDTWRLARELVNQYGRDAASIAARKADALIAKREYIGAAHWIRILRAVEQFGGSAAEALRK